jgi:hypothetical protein
VSTPGKSYNRTSAVLELHMYDNGVNQDLSPCAVLMSRCVLIVPSLENRPSENSYSVYIGAMDASAIAIPYAEDWVQLATLTTKVRFWNSWGRAIAMLIFFVGVVISLENDQPGISRTFGEGVFFLCFGAVFVILFRFFYLLARLLSWKCPRCGTKWPGLITKENHCESCGLALVSPLNS